jgi:hypothetical protein
MPYIASTLLFIQIQTVSAERQDGDVAVPAARVAAKTSRGCMVVNSEQQRLRIRMDRAALRPEVLAVAQQEIAEIWRPYGVEIEWDLRTSIGVKVVSTTDDGTAAEENEADRPPDLWVQFLDQTLESKIYRGAPAIAWIPFVSGKPLRMIRVSRPSALAILDIKAWYSNQQFSDAVPELQYTALGRVIGRAVAHEIGHFLLASPFHTKRGLMRAVVWPEEFVRPGLSRFTLKDGADRALWAAQLESCELAARASVTSLSHAQAAVDGPMGADLRRP